MRNKLTDLNNYLFETLERITDDGLSDEELEREIRRSEAVTTVAKTIISNGDLALRALKHAEEFGIGGEAIREALPPMLEMGNGKKDAD